MNFNRRIFALLPAVFVATIHAACSQETRSLVPVTPVPAFGNVQPVVSEIRISSTAITDVHLRPLFTTTIRVPDAISSVAVGAPTLFEAEHSDQEPRLIYVKPTTNKPAESNLVVTTRSGETISMRLLSDGVSTLDAPVDFIVDYRPRQSFFIGRAIRYLRGSLKNRCGHKKGPIRLARRSPDNPRCRSLRGNMVFRFATGRQARTLRRGSTAH